MFPNEEYIKTAFNGVSKTLDNVSKKAVQSDWQQNDPSAPSHIKNRVGGYDVSKTVEMSADFSPDAKHTRYWYFANGIFTAFRVSDDVTGLKEAIQNKTFSLVAMESKYQDEYATAKWIITDDYAYMDVSDGRYYPASSTEKLPLITILFGTIKPPLSVFETFDGPGIYISAGKTDNGSVIYTATSGSIRSISWTYTETEPVKIPQKYLPDPEPKDTLIVKFTPINDVFAKADHTIAEIMNAYASGKVFIKGALVFDGNLIDAGSCEVMGDAICVKFQWGNDNNYILMRDDDQSIGYMFADSSTFHFESDNPFGLNVTNPGWDGKIYVWGHEWDGSEVYSELFDGKYRIYLYGEGNSKLTGIGSNHEFVLNGTDVHAKGSIERLRDIYGDTSSAGYCYYNMFQNCASLVETPELPATTLASNCYRSMFQNCTSLVKAPELPATTLVGYCYHNMFQNCASLVKAPELPATTLAEYCYYGMFQDCASLVDAPELPATTLASNCYRSMFQNCTSLVEAPELPATTLAEYCYYNMFRNCTSLKLSETKSDEYCIPYRIPSDGTGTVASNALSMMFTNTGGTFTGTPTINTAYYLHKSNSIVGMVDEPKPVPKTDEMTQPVGLDKWTGELFTKPGGEGNNNVFVVYFSQEMGFFDCDRTYEEVNAAYEAEQQIIGISNDYIPLQCTRTYDTGYPFEFFNVAPGNELVDSAWKPICIKLNNDNTIESNTFYNQRIPVLPYATTEMSEKVEMGYNDANKSIYMKPIRNLGVTGAAVGQIAKISAVDSDGKPTAWEPVDLPSGGGDSKAWELLADVTLADDVVSIAVTQTPDGEAFSCRELAIFGQPIGDGTNKSVTVFPYGTSVGYGNATLNAGEILSDTDGDRSFFALYIQVLPEVVLIRSQYNKYNDYVGYSSNLNSTNLRSEGIDSNKYIGDPITKFAIAVWAKGTSGVFRAGTKMIVYGR